MGVANVPSAAGGGIKLVQRGEAVSARTTTITAVNTTKTFVRSFSTGAAGTVATNSVNPSVSITGTLSPSGGSTSGGTGFSYGPNQNATNAQNGTFPSYSSTRTVASGTMSGGTMDATVKQFGVHLTDSTTLTATGACRWEVVEFA